MQAARGCQSAFELKAQIDAGQLRAPDVLYVASGTMGTCAGLALGCALLGVKLEICCVAVTDTDFSSMARAKKLFDQANSLLLKADKRFPNLGFEHSGLVLREECFGWTGLPQVAKSVSPLF